MDQNSLLIVLAVIAVFVLILLLAIRGERRTRAFKRRRKEELGFQDLSHVPTPVLERVNWLHNRHPTQQIEIRNLTTLERGEYALFLMDLFDPGGETSTSQEDVLLTVSSQLSLPRFTVIPRIARDGILAEWLDKALRGLINRQGGQSVELRDPHFSENYLLFGDDRDRVASFFNRASFSSVSQSRYAMIEGGGDSFIYARLPLPANGNSPEQALQDRIREVELWFRIFRDACL